MDENDRTSFTDFVPGNGNAIEAVEILWFCCGHRRASINTRVALPVSANFRAKFPSAVINSLSNASATAG
ncbi:hypothetical protein [Sphingomonas bacterium]|uniref:hypothetical protein n=1 Tax=Sphingomonas bacterium TaxID=1895847 RepID=UPI0015752FF9|nr:hypothetical protein [Sphingomonas bacterium]